MPSYAFLIANDAFPEDRDISTLQFPKNDIDGLGEVLQDADIGNYTVRPFYNADSDKVLKSINERLAQSSRDDLVLVYYAGHGLLSKGGNLYLATHDTKKSTLSTSGISVERLLEILQESSVKRRVLILDCCHSGAIGSQIEVRGAIDSKLSAIAQQHGTYVMTASTATQTAVERESDGHGLFTKYLIEGLRTGDAAPVGNLEITADDLYDYAFRHVVGDGPQKPKKWAIAVEGVITVAKANAEKAEARQQEAREKLEGLLREGFIDGKLFGHIMAYVIGAPERDDGRFYELRRKIFDWVDGKSVFKDLKRELGDQEVVPVQNQGAVQAVVEKALDNRRVMPENPETINRSPDTAPDRPTKASGQPHLPVRRRWEALDPITPPPANISGRPPVLVLFGPVLMAVATVVAFTLLPATDTFRLVTSSANIAVAVLCAALARDSSWRWFVFLESIVACLFFGWIAIIQLQGGLS